MRKLVITVLVVVILVLLLTWLRSSDNADSAGQSVGANQLSGQLLSKNAQVSEIAQAGLQPKSKQQTNKQAQSGVANKQWLDDVNVERPRIGESQSAELKQGFATANQMLSQGRSEDAAQAYGELISEFPNFVEPYVNLAAAQAELGQLEQARQTLLNGAQANQSTKVLFDSINKVHGALAAQAYRNALETEVSGNTVVVLPKTRQVATDFDQAQQVSALTKQLAQEKSKQVSLTADSEALDVARKQLTDAADKMTALASTHKAELESFQEKLDLEIEKGRVSAGELASLKREAGEVESDLVAKLRIELSNTEAAFQQSKLKVDELLATNADLNSELASAQASVTTVAVVTEPVTPISTVATNPVVAVTKPKTVDKGISDSKQAAAINLVKAWAKSWSSQDVNAYLNFYKNNYSSSTRLNHQQWVDQRRVRLTNKGFIKVNVSNFSVTSNADEFFVTFTQHYRSNTLDDTIRKRIGFDLSGDPDWSNAKINSEKIVKR